MVNKQDWGEMVNAWRNTCILGAVYVMLGVLTFIAVAALMGFAVHSKDELREIMRELEQKPDVCQADPCVDNCPNPCPEIPDLCPPFDNADIIGVISLGCDDKDPCTVDRLRNGSCTYERLENGCACTSECHNPIGTGVCWEGRCVGAPCKGFCDDMNPCPALNFTDTSGLSVNCVEDGGGGGSGSCLYTIGPDISGALPCTESCLYLESCRAIISDEYEPLKHCLKIDVFCAHNGDITCNFFFECAVPLVL